MLNHIQCQLLAASLDFLFQDIAECDNPEIANHALRAIQVDELYHAFQESFTIYNILESVNRLRAICQHPNPQNRAVGSPYLGQTPGMVTWRDTRTSQICSESTGILGLTAQNDGITEPVTKLDVIKEIENLVGRYLTQVQQREIINLKRERDALSNNPLLIFSTLTVTEVQQGLLNQAQKYLQEDRHPEALLCLDALVNHQHRNAEYRFLRGKCLVKLERRADALADFNECIRINLRHVQALVERGYTRENLDDILGAISDYTLALQYEAQHYFALYKRGILKMKIGQIPEGEADLLASLQVRDYDPNVYSERGEQYLLIRRYPEAIVDFNEALRLRPSLHAVAAMKAEAERLMANPEAENFAEAEEQNAPRCRFM